MRQVLKRAAISCLTAPILSAQWVASVLGVRHFVQGDVFDRLLETKSLIDAGGGKKITFFTPNALTRFRAVTLLDKEPETLEWILTFGPDSILWDIGANVGVYSLYAALHNPTLKIIAIEPSIENTYLLNRNISENGLQEQIRAFPFAMSDATGPNLFRHRDLQLGGALSSFGVDYSFDGKPATFRHAYYVYGFRADDLADKFGIPQPNYIKIDVDGIEHLIARGARRVLANPVLKSALVELNFDFPEQRDEIIRIFNECGLVLQEYKHADAFYGNAAFSKIYNHIFVRQSA